MDEEKDACLERFVKFAEIATDVLREKDFWCDYIDPCSGLAMIHKRFAESVRGSGRAGDAVELRVHKCGVLQDRDASKMGE